MKYWIVIRERLEAKDTAIFIFTIKKPSFPYYFHLYLNIFFPNTFLLELSNLCIIAFNDNVVPDQKIDFFF